MCGSVRVGERIQRMKWNNEVKAAGRRKEALAACSEEAKERFMEAYRGERG